MVEGVCKTNKKKFNKREAQMPIIAILSLMITVALFAAGFQVMVDTYNVLTRWENNDD